MGGNPMDIHVPVSESLQHRRIGRRHRMVWECTRSRIPWQWSPEFGTLDGGEGVVVGGCTCTAEAECLGRCFSAKFLQL